MNEKIVEDSMNIIMHAGDARESCKNALDALMAEDFKHAEELMGEADKEIAEAHHIQTDCIQKAIAGEPFEYNVLFAHAQDTLMTIYSEISLAKKMLMLYKRIDERIGGRNSEEVA